MAITNKYKRITLSEIKVDRENRQRREVSVDDLLPSIRARGVLSPIIVDEQLNLIAGERRYTASLQLGLPDIPARFVTDLSETEKQIIELEENLKRQDLSWQDECAAILRIHELYVVSGGEEWNQSRTAEAIGMTSGALSVQLRVAQEMRENNPKIAEAGGLRAAYNILSRTDSRAVDDAMNDLLAASAPAPAVKPTATATGKAVSTVGVPTVLAGLDKEEVSDIKERVQDAVKEGAPLPADASILVENFHHFAENYAGVPYNLIHCDFPYGVNMQDSEQGNTSAWGGYDDRPEVYWELCATLAKHRDKLMSQSAHLVFWFSMEFYHETLEFFSKHAPDIEFQKFPLYWHKSDNRGILPDPKRGPRRVTETAFLASRGDRLIVKAVSNTYAAPSSKSLHQSEKPEPVLRHFFQMLVDENTRLLDPTCGSASSLRAAESLGASHVLGLELNEEFAGIAKTELNKFRTLRALDSKKKG